MVIIQVLDESYQCVVGVFYIHLELTLEVIFI